MTHRTRSRRFATIACAVVCVAAGAPGGIPAPTDAAWQPLRFPGVDTPTEFRPAPGIPEALEAEAKCGASARMLSLSQIDLKATPVLHWRWRVLEPLSGADERTKAGDDFAARVYVMFEFEPERASWFERAQRQVGESLYGRQLPGAALAFVWTQRVAPGTTWTSPYTDETKMMALATGAGEEWKSESIDVHSAFADAFGYTAPRAVGLAVMTDADNTCRKARAQFDGFRFTRDLAP